MTTPPSTNTTPSLPAATPPIEEGINVAQLLRQLRGQSDFPQLSSLIQQLAGEGLNIDVSVRPESQLAVNPTPQTAVNPTAVNLAPTPQSIVTPALGSTASAHIVQPNVAPALGAEFGGLGPAEDATRIFSADGAIGGLPGVGEVIRSALSGFLFGQLERFISPARPELQRFISPARPAANSTPQTQPQPAVDSKASAPKVMVYSADDRNVITLRVGGQRFVLHEKTLERIPALHRQISSVVSTADLKSENRREYYVECDSTVFERIYLYAMGNHSFLTDLGMFSLNLLRFEAIRFEMPTLVEDIDWIIHPTPDPSILASIDETVTNICQYLHQPMVHAMLLQIPGYSIVFEYLTNLARDHSRSLEAEIQHIIREFANTTTFEDNFKSEVMPSIRRGEALATEFTSKPNAWKVLLPLYLRAAILVLRRVLFRRPLSAD